MEKSNKRGKIPQTDWPLIMARYEAGETLASIARTYDCSPPAISYVVSRSRTRPAAEAPKPVRSSDPQLVKNVATDDSPAEELLSKTVVAAASTDGSNINGKHREMATDAADGDRSGTRPHLTAIDQPVEIHEETTETHKETTSEQPPIISPRVDARLRPAAIASAGHANGDHRGTLHLSLGQSPSGHSPRTPPLPGHPPPGQPQQTELAIAPIQLGMAEPRAAVRPEPYHRQGQEPQTGYGSGVSGFNERTQAAYRPERIEPAHRKDGNATYIDTDLRARVNDDIAAFLAAFDAALIQDTQESRSGLREATDRLLRAGARTRIELERLEARIPLPQRDGSRGEPAWRR